MIQPDDIRRKADTIYEDFVRAWLAGEAEFFPRVVRGLRVPDGDLSSAITSMRRLREASKQVTGVGYSVDWREVNSRKFGRNPFPRRVYFENQEDLLRYVGKLHEFERLSSAVSRVRLHCPELESWTRSNWRTLLDMAQEVDGLLEVVRYFREAPRPKRFARELPIAVHTKFIEEHQRVLREWLDLILPPHAIRADEEHFERRYGLRYVEPHLVVRFLDSALQRELGFPCSELSVPLGTMVEWSVANACIIIVENKINLLTLPAIGRTLALGALGNGAELLRHVRWLEHTPITYWGDIDVEGFEILSRLRRLFPHTRSIMMDEAAVSTWRSSMVSGSGRRPQAPVNLTPGEAAAFRLCANHNLRFEQERVPHAVVIDTFPVGR